MIVVADSTPINYLILIEEIEVLPKLYGRVIIPRAVKRRVDALSCASEGAGVDKTAARLVGSSFPHCCRRCQTSS